METEGYVYSLISYTFQICYYLHYYIYESQIFAHRLTLHAPFYDPVFDWARVEEMADVLICFDLLTEIYGLKPSDLRRMIDHKVWRMKRRLEAQGEKF